jgi:hypothetical protein
MGRFVVAGASLATVGLIVTVGALSLTVR